MYVSIQQETGNDGSFEKVRGLMIMQDILKNLKIYKETLDEYYLIKVIDRVKENISAGSVEAFHSFIDSIVFKQLPAGLAGWWEEDGKQFICDGYQGYMLNEFIYDSFKLDDSIKKFNLKKVIETHSKNDVEIKLPPLHELTAKLMSHRREKNDLRCLVELSDTTVNVEYLIMAIKLLSADIGFLSGKKDSIIYFKTEIGCGIVLPVCSL